ncbi:hypothetical protein QYE76_012044 [Lolium multiflorum]|uniref:Transposase (putative) gypsy type domain-containing protein n=1 Tax=Lolium multiflorum TaxID=4521 RepID=A0AAD8TYI2_LOLMU|nr:hypothetical protein QYE76_012044 [Lolium multiflorum]
MAFEEFDLELFGSSQISEEPEISWGEENTADQEASGQEKEIDGLEQEAGPSSAAYSRGRWRGSDVTEAEIDWLYRSQRIPEGVTCRILGDELEPVLNPGKVVVFTAHFERGFGLPASDFFRRFLNFYKLQPHHLPGNVVFYLSSFVSFMEGYVGLWPTTETFARSYNLRINSIQDPKLPLLKPVVQCGACIITPRQKSPYYKLSGLESYRKWQQTFFYIKNSGPIDLINLPAYVPGEPARTKWQSNPRDTHEETNRIIRYIKKLKRDTNLSADDIVRTFILRRVLPLQRRADKICQMTVRFDPTRITTFRLYRADVVAKAKQICKIKMPVKWECGLEPHIRKRPPTPQNFARISTEEPASFTPNRTEEDTEDQNHSCARDGLLPQHGLRAPLELTRRLPKIPGKLKMLLGKVRHTPVPARLLPPPGNPHQVRGTRPLITKITAPRGDFSSPPEFEDPGASNMGAGSDQIGRSKPLVPPVLEKTTEAPSASPTKTSSSAPPNLPSLAKGPAMPLPTSIKKPPPAPSGKKFSSRRNTAVTVEQLSGAVQAAVAQPASSQSLTLHVGRVAVAVSEKISAQTGRIIELNRGAANLGSLQKYLDEWNLMEAKATWVARSHELIEGKAGGEEEHEEHGEEHDEHTPHNPIQFRFTPDSPNHYPDRITQGETRGRIPERKTDIRSME